MEQSHVKLVAIGVLQTRGACHLGADHGDTHGRGRRRGQQARLHPCKWCTARTVLPETKQTKQSTVSHRDTCMHRVKVPIPGLRTQSRDVLIVLVCEHEYLNFQRRIRVRVHFTLKV